MIIICAHLSLGYEKMMPRALLIQVYLSMPHAAMGFIVTSDFNPSRHRKLQDI